MNWMNCNSLTPVTRSICRQWCLHLWTQIEWAPIARQWRCWRNRLLRSMRFYFWGARHVELEHMYSAPIKSFDHQWRWSGCCTGNRLNFTPIAGRDNENSTTARRTVWMSWIAIDGVGLTFNSSESQQSRVCCRVLSVIHYSGCHSVCLSVFLSLEYSDLTVVEEGLDMDCFNR